jgi:hypothetical protein
MKGPEHIPPEIWTMATQSGQRNGSYEQTVKTAEMLMRRAAGRDALDEDRVQWQPFLSYKQTEIILRALMEYETVFDAHVSELYKLRSWFSSMER